MSYKKVLFVCLGNICRSPMAEGVFRKDIEDAGLNSKVEIDSAGTGSWHVGALPDERSREVLLSKGIDISDQRARAVVDGDFKTFDFILAMDKSNYDSLIQLSPQSYHSKIKLFLEFSSSDKEVEVPDPYYGGEDGFYHIYKLIKSASEGLVEEIKRELS